MSSPSVTHQALVTIFNGVSRNFTTPGSPSVWQFRGLRYGNIPARFTQATLNQLFPTPFDGTSYGPKCPQPPTAARLEDVLIGTPPKVVPKNQPDVFDEFGCLNLNITMPPLNQNFAAALPVMVYVHGGGGFSGSNSDWWCDGGPLVSKSIAIGRPIIHVAVNYRLSALGFIGSSELRQELGEKNGGNFAYHDINLALTWISKYINGFGGSNDQITLYGESAGAVATDVLLHSNLPPLFSRCILQSSILGSPLFFPPETIRTKSAVFQKAKTTLGIKTVKEMQAVPAQDLIAALTVSDPRGGLPHVPMIDDILLSDNWASKFSFPRGRSGSVMIGNTETESSVISAALLPAPKPVSPPLTNTLISSLHGVLSSDKVQNLLDAYQIREDIDSPTVKQNILKLVQDIGFLRPPYALVSALQIHNPSANVYRYSFKKPNPFDGSFHNIPNHALDLAYIHGDPAIFTGTDNEIAEMVFQDKMKEIWIKFADGERVWDEDMWMEMGFPAFSPTGVLEYKFNAKTEKVFENNAPRVSFAWPAVDALSAEEKTVVMGLLLGHLAAMGGVTV